MNTHTHCTIPNRKRGCLMAVAETAKSSRKASGGNRASRKARSALCSGGMWLQANQGEGYEASQLISPSQATIGLINNGGDLSKTLEQMGSSESIRGLVTSMATAAAMSYVNSMDFMKEMTTDKITGQPIKFADLEFTQKLGVSVANSATGAVTRTALNGGSLGDALVQSIGNGLTTALAAQGANALHLSPDQQGDLMAQVSNKLGHALIGCAAAKANSAGNNCQAGAMGAVIGETAAELLGKSQSEVDAMSKEEKQAYESGLVNTTKLISASIAAAAGLDPNAAAVASSNAVENNRLSTPKERLVMQAMAVGNPDKEQRLNDALCVLIKCSAQFKTGTQEYVDAKNREVRGAGNTAELQELQDANNKNPSLFGYSLSNRITDGAKNVGNSIVSTADKAGGFVTGLVKGGVDGVAQTGLTIIDVAKVSGAAQLEAATGTKVEINPVSGVGQSIQKDGVVNTITNAPGNALRTLSGAMQEAGQGNFEPLGEIGGSIATPALIGKGAGVLLGDTVSGAGRVVGTVDSDAVVVGNTANKGSGPLYDPKTARADLEATSGAENVTSTTVANNPLQRVNSNANQGVNVIENSSGKAVEVAYTDPITGQAAKANIPYDSRGLPVFDNVSKYTTNIAPSLSYEAQMTQATRDLRDAVNSGKVDAGQFTPNQLNAIQSGDSKIPGLTWHHNAQSAPNNMQLVPTKVHSEVTHLGQGSLSQGK